MTRVLYTNDVLSLEGSGITARLIPLSGAGFTVSTVSGTPVPLFNDAALSSTTIGSTVYASANGIVRFYVEPGTYVARITSGTTVDRIEEFFVPGDSLGSGGLPSNVPIIYPESKPYDIRGSTPDSTLAFQALLNEAYAKYGHAQVMLSDRYNITTLDVPDTIDLVGISRTESGFSRVTGKNGPMLVLKPITGRNPQRVRQTLHRFYMDGNNVGVLKGTGIVTLGSDVVTTVQSSVLAQLQVGYRIEGIGIPKDTWVSEIYASSLRMSVPADRSNSPKTNLVFRKGVSITATAPTISRTVTVASTNNIEVGMRASGRLVEDSDDGDPDTSNSLNAWTRVAAVDPISNTVTFDRDISTVGAYVTNFFVANDGTLVEEGWLAPNYNSTKNYASVGMSEIDIINCGFHGLAVRGRRNQFQGNHLKVSNNFGGGVVMTAANDSYLHRVGTGTNWMWALSIVAMATPRWSGEAWQTYLNDKYPDVVVRGAREFIGIDADINGRIHCIGNSDSSATQQLYTLTNINFKWTTPNAIPGSTDSAYIEAKHCIVVASGGGMVPDSVDGTRPHHGGKVTPGGDGAVFFTSQHWNDDPADPRCPWSVSMGAPGSAVVSTAILNNTSRQVQGELPSEFLVSDNANQVLQLNTGPVCITSGSSSLSALTITLPSSPPHKHLVAISFSVPVSALSIASPDSKPITGAPLSVAKGQSLKLVYSRLTGRWVVAP